MWLAHGPVRWRLVAANNRTIADSGESYWNKTDCEAVTALVTSTNALTPVVEHLADPTSLIPWEQVRRKLLTRE